MRFINVLLTYLLTLIRSILRRKRPFEMLNRLGVRIKIINVQIT